MSLPSGWTETKLSEIADFVMGQAPPGEDCNFNGIGTPFVKAGEFGRERPEIKEWTTRPLKLAKHDDVLICVVGATAGKLNRGADCAIGRSVAAIRPSPATSADFLFPRMKSEVARLRGASVGTAQGVISRELLGEVDIALPPLAEQGRIVAELDALFARLARAQAELDRVVNLSKKAREAVYSRAFARFTGHMLKLGSVLEDIRYGTAKKCDYGDGVPVLRIPNIASGRISIEDLKRADFESDELTKLSLRLGDVLVIRSNGSRDLVGRSAVVDDAAAGMLYAGYLIRLRLDESKLLPDYLHAFLSSPSARQTIEGLARSTSGVNNINAEQLKTLMIPAATLEAQRSVISTIQSANAHAGRLELEVARARALLDRLEAAILSKAFKGELVPQDPNDEPASVLLERMKVARAQELEPQSRRGRKATAQRAPREKTAMTKSRQDDEVKDKPYLAEMIRKVGGASTVEELFKLADLPLTDFYKQLAWEIDGGHIIDDANRELKAA